MTNFFSFASSDLRHILNILLVLLISVGIRILFSHSLKVLFGKAANKITNEKMLARTKTARYLLASVVDIVVIFIAILTIFSNLGMDIGPILTGAGILGLAVSFGSQSLIKDVLSGFFIILEEQFNVGDEVKIGEYSGVVYKLTLRTTVLKDKEENLIFIPNSQIVSVLRKKKLN